MNIGQQRQAILHDKIKLPESIVPFDFKMELNDLEYTSILMGYTSFSMDDRWGACYNDSKIYIYRSWTGNVTIILELKEDQSYMNRNHKIINAGINEEYYKALIEEEKEGKLLSIKYFDPSGDYKNPIDLDSHLNEIILDLIKHLFKIEVE